MGKLMPSLGVRILYCAQEMMHIHNNLIVCCGLINFRCSCMLQDDSLLNEIATATTSDPFAKEIMARINDPSPSMKSSYLNQFTTLSRRPDFALRPGDDAYSQQSHCLLRPDELQMFATCMLQDDSLLNEIATTTMSDPFAKKSWPTSMTHLRA